MFPAFPIGLRRPGVQFPVAPTGGPAVIYGLLQTGQSLGMGYPGGTIIGAAQPGHYMLTGGLVELHQTTPWAVVNTGGLSTLAEQLVTLDGFAAGENGLGAAVEILASSTGLRFIAASVATQSLGIASRAKSAGNNIYTNTLAVVTAMKARVEAAGLVFGGVLAVFEVGGETDFNSAAYYADLLQYQQDLSDDIIAITGQSTPSPIPMFLSQIVGQAAFLNNDSSHSQVVAARTYPTRFALAGAKFPFTSADGQHLSPAGYRQMGALYAHAVEKWRAAGTSQVPMPDLGTISRVGAVYTVDFVTPTPPLVLDTSLVTQQAAPQLYGFEVYNGGFVNVSSVTVGDGPNGTGTRLTVTCASNPGGGAWLRYAVGISGDDRTAGGPVNGPRGNVRDSSAWTDADGNAWPGHYAPRFQLTVA